jgi:hypothetical protein
MTDKTPVNLSQLQQQLGRVILSKPEAIDHDLHGGMRRPACGSIQSRY